MLVEKDRGALRISGLDPHALRAGLSLGMALAQARAVLPALDAAEADPVADAAYLQQVAEFCDRFTPHVGLWGKEGLILDITGCAHLFGGEARLLGRVRRALAKRGLSSRAAIAPTAHAAWAFAHHLPNRIVSAEEVEALARALPLTALGQDTETVIALSRAGLRTLADLADRPPAMLAARFGSPLTEALRRVLGREDLRITPLRTEPEITAEEHFPEPLGLMDSLLQVLERLLRQVTATLEAREAGVRALEVSFFRADGQVRRVGLETAESLRDVAALLRVVRLKIEALADPLDPGFGFDAVRLMVLRSEGIAPRQAGLAGATDTPPPPGALAALIDRLMARFEPDRVRRFVGRATHDPVRAGGTLGYLPSQTARPRGAETRFTLPADNGPPARPLTFFHPAHPIEALSLLPDGPPRRFRWQRRVHEVTAAEGPERIAPAWWRLSGTSQARARDYYRLEDTEGRRFWVFREGLYEPDAPPPRWFLQGLFA